MKLGETWLRIGMHAGALLPLGMLLFDMLVGNLGPEPIREAILRTGKTALVLLVLTLACTPLNTLFSFKQALKLRRTLGLYAFGYAMIHFLIFTGVDYAFDWGLLKVELLKRRYALVGLAAGTTMLPLALTSFKYWQKRLGKNWKRLHRLIYLVGVLVAIHYIWLVKPGVIEPWYWAGGIALLLVLRLPIVRKLASRLR